MNSQGARHKETQDVFFSFRPVVGAQKAG